MKKIFNIAIVCMALVFASCEQNGPSWKNGIGAFSVAPDKQVAFSPGNLEYNENTFEWCFSENSLDGISFDRWEAGWIDEFVWDDFVDDKFVDWGMYTIGKDSPYTWRSLTKEELEFLLFKRANADKLFGVAAVYEEDSDWDCRGLILLPDNWECPNGIAFVPGVSDGSSVGSEGYAHHQMLTIEEWSKMEKKGAVFLRTNTFDSDGWFDGTYSGYYFLSTIDKEEHGHPYTLYFDHETMPKISGFYGGGDGSVRLVKDL